MGSLQKAFITLFFLSFRHFLFKTGTGTTPFFGAAAPGYTMATGTVYSTPARPLPRNSLSRGAFKFKKSPKHCSWKCTALVAVGVAVVLSIILSYCIGEAQLGRSQQQQTFSCMFVPAGLLAHKPLHPNAAFTKVYWACSDRSYFHSWIIAVLHNSNSNRNTLL